jgi:hypothetical protein
VPKCVKCGFTWVSTTRSNPQNKYYFGVIVDMISEETGNEPEETHELLKLKFLKSMGKKNTTQLTTVEFNTYIEKIQRWASIELSLIIPDPQ